MDMPPSLAGPAPAGQGRGGLHSRAPCPWSPVTSRGVSPARGAGRRDEGPDRQQTTTGHLGGPIMKIVVIGGTGLIGSKVVTDLSRQGHEAVAASPASGGDTLTGGGVPGGALRAS